MNRVYRVVWNQVSNTWTAVAENARGRGKSTGGAQLVAAAVALASVSFMVPSAQAADAAQATVAAGAGSVSTVGSTTTIHQTSARLALDWTSLSTRPNESLVFKQPNAQAVALNRITGSSPSEFLGSLSANGQVFVLNPNGVLFGNGAQVNVGGLVASTLSLGNADFMAGKYVFGASASMGGGASVINRGTLRAADGGYVALLAPQVRNEGVVTAQLGTALLAAGNKVTLNLDNGSLLGYSIDQGALQALVDNKQLIQADGGQVLLSAKAADALSTSVVNNSGIIEARSIQNKAGRILLTGDAAGGTVTVGGTLDASAYRGGSGGAVHVTAGKVVVKAGALIDASGAEGGGEVLVGGGWQGKDARVAHAAETTLETGSTIKANATGNGHGGTVVAWSDEHTRVGGRIEARGGAEGGNGGNVETSGKQHLVFRAQVDTSAPKGRAGHLLLDPQDITIVNGSGGADDGLLADNVVGAGEPNTTTDVTLSEQTLEGLSGNVTLQATRDVIFQNLGDDRLNMNGVTAGSTFTVTAGRHIVQTADTNDRIQTNGGAVSLATTNGQIDIGGVLSGGGSVTLAAGGAAGSLAVRGIVTAPAVGNGGAISLTSAGAMALGAGNIDARGGGVGTTGDVTLASGAAMTVQSGATVHANDLRMSANGGIANNLGAAANVQAARVSALNAGSGDLLLAHTGTNRIVVADLGAGQDGIQNAAAGGNTSLAAAGAAVQVLGSKVSAAGGNVVVSAAGNSATHSLEIVNNGGTLAQVTTTGAGAITLNGNLSSGGASATGGSAGGVVVTGSNITGGSGDITITGDAGFPSGVAQVSRGVRLDAGTTVSGAGKITVTGRVGSSASMNSMGTELAAGAEVSSTGGDVTLSGTLNNPSIAAGVGLQVNGKVQSGPSSKITLNGSATVGGSAGTGVRMGALAELFAGVVGLTVTGTVASSTTATAIVGTQLDGAINSTGAIAISGVAAAPSASGVIGVDVQGGTISSSGAAITVTGSGVPAPAPASSRDVQIAGGVLNSGGGEIRLLGDRMNLASNINSGSGRTVLSPTTNSRPITLGGASETAALNLSNSELNLIAAGLLVIGGALASGGITIGNSGGTIAPVGTPALSLNTTGAITQIAPLTISQLQASGATVTLNNVANQIDTVSGRSTAGAFQLSSSKAAPLTVGTVDGVAGINSAGAATSLLNLSGALAQTQPIVAGSFTGSSSGGMTLNLASNQVGAFWVSNSATGNIVLRNGTASAFTSVANTGSGNIDIVNNGAISGAQAYTTAGAAGDISVSSTGALDTADVTLSTNGGSAQTISLTAGTGITVGAAFGNSQDRLKLIATVGNININGALSAGELTLNTSGAAAQTGAIIATGLELLGGGSYNLNHAGNAVTTLAGNTGNVSYTQAGALAIGTVNTAGLAASGKVLVRTTGATSDLTLNNTVTSGSAASDSLVLAAGRNFINNAGGAALNAGTGRWLVWSGDPANDTRGGLAYQFKQYNAVFGSTAVAQGTGNGFLYRLAPTVAVSLTGNVTKVYDATTTANLAPANFSAAAGVDGDTITLVTAAGANYDTPNAGTGKTVTAHGVAVGAASNGAAAVYGYGVAGATASGAIGIITPAPVGVGTPGTISLNGTRVYDGTVNVNAGIFTLSGLVAGQDLTLSGVGTVADKNVGSNKPVSLGSLALGNGSTGLASNYTLTGGTHVATITPAQLAVAAHNQYKAFAAADPLLSYSASGWVGGDTAATALQGNLVRAPGEATGLYAITQGSLASVGGNYTLSFTPGSLAIVPRVQGGTPGAVDAAAVAAAARAAQAGERAAEQTAAQTTQEPDPKRRAQPLVVVDEGMRLPDGLAPY